MIDESLPEPVKAFLRSGKTLEEIRLHADGRWTHVGLDFENQRVIDLFHRSVAQTAGGTWVLEIGRFTYPIVVDDCGFFVTAISFDDTPHTITISDDSVETLDLTTLRYDGDSSLYCSIKDGAFEARFLKGPYLRFADRFDERDGAIWYGDVKLFE